MSGTSSTRFDWTRLAEAAYALDGDDRAWLEGIFDAVAPEFDRGHGMAGGLAYRRGGRFTSSFDVLRDQPPSFARLTHLCWRLFPAAVDRFFETRSIVASSDFIPGGVDRMRRVAARFGLPTADQVGLTAADDQGRYVCIAGVRNQIAEPVTPAQRRVWARLSNHVGAGLRLRSAVHGDPLSNANVEGIFDPEGRCAHAQGFVKEAGVREQMRERVLDVMRSKDRGARYELDSTSLWEAVVSGRWSLVDRFDRDGKHFVVAYRNGVMSGDPRALTPTERRVAERAGLGASSKEIAAVLDISETAVSTHLSRAMRKLGVRSRLELVVQTSPGPTRALRFSIASREFMAEERRLDAGLAGDARLTDAERQVLEGLVVGHSNRAIAEQRGVSEKTIANQVASILRKLGVASRQEVVALALSSADPSA